MAGYTRQSTADITANAVIKAAPVNAEYNALRDVFAFATGHKHDGSSTEGAYVPLIADVDALNKVVIDTINNRIGFFSQVGSGTVEQLRIQDGAFVPVTDSDIDLGAAGAEFKDLYIDGIGYIDTVAVHENATIAGTLGVTGLSTLATVDINGGNIDGTTIAGGTLNNAQIGNTAASTVVGTTVTASNFVGPIAGAVTGNVTGNTAGVHTGAVTGDITGNVTAGSGSSSFTNVVINGSLDMNAGTSATITGLSNPVQNSDAATKQYVDTVLAATVDAAPAALDTLNELAAALGDDANYAATTTTALGTKLPLAGGTMSGPLAMGTSKITGLGTPTAGTDATHKTYVDGIDALKVTKAGDSMSGVLAMGANKITGVADPTANQDAATKVYVDVILGSATAAATSASNASTSEQNALASKNAAATSYDNFDDRFLGSKSSNPTVDNDGGSLLTGAIYWNSSVNASRVYTGSSWVNMAPSAADQALINIVGADLTYIEDLGSITAAVTTSSGNSISVVGAAITNVNLVGNSISNVNSVGSNIANVNAVNTNSSNINSAVSNASNINSAVGNSANINNAVSNASNINAAVANQSNINAVAGNNSNITAVAGNASNINAAVSNASNINSVVANATNVNSVAGNMSDVNAFVNKYRISSSAPTSSLDSGDLWWSTSTNELRAYNTTTSGWQATSPSAEDQAAIDIVAGDIIYSEDLGSITASVTVGTGAGQIALVGNNITNVNLVGGSIANVNTVGSGIANVNSVAGNASNINAAVSNASNINSAVSNASNINAAVSNIANIVAAGSISSDITAVADNASNVTTVAGSIANVNTVAGNTSNITAVAGNASNINSAVGNTSNINSAVSNSANINLVAGSITNVNTAAGDIANINIVAGSMADVNRYANEYAISSTAPSNPSVGDLWMDTTTNIFKYWNGTYFGSIISGLTHIHEDASPQLAAALDGQNNNLTNIGTISGSNLQLDFGGL
tara:strand:+ start:1549 stop:4494 length:2946 start_codon:yes stop_codon:yes gene_type:complete